MDKEIFNALTKEEQRQIIESYLRISRDNLDKYLISNQLTLNIGTIKRLILSITQTEELLEYRGLQ